VLTSFPIGPSRQVGRSRTPPSAEIAPEILAALDDHADASGISTSELLNTILANYLKEHPPK